ncbi:transcriptional regulator domain-containing protein [Mesorhizobium atlanticum]|uniref:transcriptional regulator domain-containing protein n=1 Tax=Mesorhizobium atlanticum TaxID=2233532 RepID=UPI001FE0AB2A|nr:DUF6499 domain-containing protein [Mesorhizobium atlanticum]
MKPDTSHWRDNTSYEFFDDLPVEGLAWECLRRSDAYQRHYLALVRDGTERNPLPTEAQERWGLRFRGSTRLVRIDARRSVVTACRPRGGDPHAIAGFPIMRIPDSACRGRYTARESARFPCHPRQGNCNTASPPPRQRGEPVSHGLDPARHPNARASRGSGSILALLSRETRAA